MSQQYKNLEAGDVKIGSLINLALTTPDTPEIAVVLEIITVNNYTRVLLFDLLESRVISLGLHMIFKQEIIYI